jgi:hypothetical protein
MPAADAGCRQGLTALPGGTARPFRGLATWCIVDTWTCSIQRGCTRFTGAAC